jgi:predicted O-methyltransferase YrrM
MDFYYQKSFPEHPWLTSSANHILSSCLKQSDIGLEFGSGRSTIWFAKRIKQLISIEHDTLWHQKVQKMLKDNMINNVNLHLIPKNKREDSGKDAEYVKIVEWFAPDSVDFVLVDGVYREFCALRSLQIIRRGGILIIDNANWFLPYHSHAPHSRSVVQGPKGEVWEEVHRTITNWRKIWTSSGVTDTAFFFKPCN